MPWLQLRIDTTPEQSDALEDALLAAGAASVTLEDNADQPILEPALGETPLWNQTRISGLFSADIDTEQVLTVASSTIGEEIKDFRWELLEDRNWERAWMDNFEPLCFGQRLWICPSWKEPPEPTAVNLMLDPGLAFGTGTHPTTALCLRWLDGFDVSGKTVIDYGCGSGILAIAALLLGAKQVIAVDNDPQALIATRENASRNQVEGQVSTYLPEQLPADCSGQLMLANILAGPLAELAPTLGRMTEPGGNIVLSGLLDSQAEEVAECYRDQFDMGEIAIDDHWCRLVGTRVTAAAS